MSLDRVVYLSPTFRPYRVPVFDAMQRMIGNGFCVVQFSGQRRATSHRAYAMGGFRRKFVPGWRLVFSSKASNAGQATPMGAYLTPTLPLVLAMLRPQVVISNNFGVWSLISLFMGYRTVIFWEGTDHTERTVKPWRLRLRRWMARRAKALVVNGAASAAYVADRLNIEADKIFEGGMCAEPLPDKVGGRGPRRATAGETIRFIFVGQLIRRKAPEQLLRAVAELKSVVSPDARFEVVILGNGGEKPLLQTLASSLDIDDRVRFLDYVPPEEVWDIYLGCHVFVLPTRQDNWPLVVPEAMALGMPLLLSKVTGSVSDLLREGENGYTFDPSDPVELARLMAGYIDKPELVARHGTRSIELVKSYTPEHAAGAYIAACQRSLGEALDRRTDPTGARS